MRSRRVGIAVIAAVAVLAALAAWARLGPLPEGFLARGGAPSTVLTARGGEPLYEALSAGGARLRPLAAGEVPPLLAAATLAAEDRRFFLHPGVDPLALARAAWRNARASRVVEGGSTLTQQVAKMLSGRRGRGAGDKLRESILALRLEHRLSKREILAMYLTLAPYGRQYRGARAAANAYFGADVASLTAAQAAYLAALPQRPGALDPHRDAAAAVPRQRTVLARMAAAGSIDAGVHQAALAERLLVNAPAHPLAAPHFVERALAVLEREGDVATIRAETTLDLPLQRTVAGILAQHRERLAAHGARNVAVAVLDNARGEWLAWEGSGNWGDSRGGAIDGVMTPRQPGSALKPFTYALAFAGGMTPAAVLPDLPSHFPTAVAGVLYSPRNYDGRFRGPMRARPALGGSENIPAVWTLARVGVPELLGFLRAAGFSTLDATASHYGYGLTMGDAEVRLADMVAAYGMLARGGIAAEPRLLRRVKQAGGSGAWIDMPVPTRRRLLGERAAFWVADVLADPEARAWAFGRGGALEFPFPVAVKTGTSQAYRDNWTVGFTRAVTVGVWVGNFDRQELQHSSGVTGAAPIFHEVLMAAEERVSGRLPTAGDVPLAAPPADLERRTICALSGETAGEDCPARSKEWLPAATTTAPCTWHTADEGIHWPAQYASWAEKKEPARTPAVPVEAKSKLDSSAQQPRLRIENPPEGATYLRDPTLRREAQTLPLRAQVAGVARRLLWSVDGKRLGAVSSSSALDWPLAPGRHVVTVEDGSGARATAAIEVR